MDQFLVAGAVSGAVALVVFVVAHAIWIVPVWWLLAFTPLTMLIGALASWPFRELQARAALPSAPWDGLAFSAILLLTLVPTVVAGMAQGPVSRDAVTFGSVVPPLLLAIPAGAVLGGSLAGSVRGAAALALAAGALALTLGHNLPFFPLGAPSWERAFAMVIGTELAAGASFTATRMVLAQLSSAV